MYFRFEGPLKEERLKVPEEIAKVVPKGLKSLDKNDYILNHIILNSEYYDKIIPQSVAEFFQYFFVNCRTEGGYPIYDEMEINDLVICVVGHTRENEAHTQMFAYRKQEKD